jgi:hypothetical protein
MANSLTLILFIFAKMKCPNSCTKTMIPNINIITNILIKQLNINFPRYITLINNFYFYRCINYLSNLKVRCWCGKIKFFPDNRC